MTHGSNAGRWTRTPAWTVLLSCILFAGHAIAESVVNVLGRDQGLPSSQIQDLAFHDGVLWMATPVGLAEWDGVRVRVESKGSGLSSHGLRAISVGSDGLWIGSDRGLDLLPEGEAIRPVTPSAWDAGFVNRLLRFDDGVLIGSANGLYTAASSGDIEFVEQVPAELVTDLATSSDGAIWAVGPSLGLWRFADGRWSALLSTLDAVQEPLVTLAPSTESSIWAGGSAGLWQIDSEGRVMDFLDSEETSAVVERQGELWVGSRGDLNRYASVDGVWELQESLPKVFANRLLIDPDGNLWVATDAKGLLKVSVLRFAIQRVANPCDTQVFSLQPGAESQILVGGLDCSWRLSSDLKDAHRIPGLDGTRVWDLMEVDGDLWAASQSGLLTGTESSAFERVPGAPGAARGPCRALLKRRGETWLATVDGLWIHKAGQWTEALTEQGSPFSYVYTLEKDAAGRLWVGTIGRGLWRETTEYRFRQVIGPGLDPMGNAYGISTTEDGAWVLSDSTLVRVVDSGEPQIVLSTEDGIAGWSVTTGHGAVWIGGNRGLYEMATDSHKVRWAVPPSAGPPGSEFTTSRSLMRLADDRLLTGTAAGLAVVSPNEIRKVRPPTIRLRELRWRGTKVRETLERIHIPHGRWDLAIHVTSGFLADESSIRYRHRLHGFSDQWSEPATAEKLPWHYTTLPAGSYRLEGQAFSTLTGWGDVELLAEFDVDRPWWAQVPALFGWALLLAAIFFGSWRWRERRLRSRTAELERLVSQRTRSLEKARRKLEKLAAIDPLTNIANRRTFTERASEFMQRAIRANTRFSLVLIDLDHFKSINDRFGHQSGDLALKHAVAVLDAQLRASDILARFGGEEFAVLLEGDGIEEAGLTAERLRSALDTKTLDLEGAEETLVVRASFGCAEWQPEISFDELVRRADQALYKAKRKRNSVVIWSDGQCLSTSDLTTSSYPAATRTNGL